MTAPRMAIRRVSTPSEDSYSHALLWCPGCDKLHVINIEGTGPVTPAWSWNGDISKPTFDPSLHVSGVQWASEYGFYMPNHKVEAGQPITCHSFIRNGQWEFLADCTHIYAGQTVPMVPLPDWVTANERAHE